MPITEKQREANRKYLETQRKQKLAEGKMKNLESRVVLKEFGLRVIVSTFNKYEVSTINLEGTVNCEGGTYDGETLRMIEFELKRLFNKWVFGGQTDYYTKYIAIIDVQDDYNKTHNWNYIKYVPKSKHIKFDITLKVNGTPSWKDTVEVATKHIRQLYGEIVKVIEGAGLKLKDFKGHNLKSGVAKTTEPETS